MTRRTLTAFGAAILLVALTGCGPAQPTYTELRQQTRELMQEVVDVLPADSTVADISTEVEYACDDGSGSFYTGNWTITTPELDADAFIQSLPEVLGEGWRENSHAMQSERPSVALVHGDTLVRVSILDEEEIPTVRLIAISPCGQPTDG